MCIYLHKRAHKHTKQQQQTHCLPDQFPLTLAPGLMDLKLRKRSSSLSDKLTETKHRNGSVLDNQVGRSTSRTWAWPRARARYCRPGSNNHKEPSSMGTWSEHEGGCCCSQGCRGEYGSTVTPHAAVSTLV